MNLILESRSILEAASFLTSLSTARSSTCFFEDESLLGSVTVYETTEALLSRWEQNQDAFLVEHAVQFRTHPLKAWNIYTVHLTTDQALDALSGKLFDVEGDFRGTRKIARAGIGTKDDLRMALLPLLPLANKVTLSKDNMTERIRDRLTACHPSLSRLLESELPEDIARSMLEAGQ